MPFHDVRNGHISAPIEKTKDHYKLGQLQNKYGNKFLTSSNTPDKGLNSITLYYNRRPR